MPRFPISVQRTAAPTAFSSSPRARPADFGAGLGEAVADFGFEAARLGRAIGQRREREAEQEAAENAAENAAEKAAEDARAGRQAEREAARMRMARPDGSPAACWHGSRRAIWRTWAGA